MSVLRKHTAFMCRIFSWEANVSASKRSVRKTCRWLALWACSTLAGDRVVVWSICFSNSIQSPQKKYVFEGYHVHLQKERHHSRGCLFGFSLKPPKRGSLKTYGLPKASIHIPCKNKQHLPNVICITVPNGPNLTQYQE